MKIKNEKEVLQAFCKNDDELRPILNSPFFCEPTGEVRASDGCIMLMVDPKLLRRKYAASDFSAWLTIHRQNSNTIVKLDDIEEVFNQFELVPEMIEEEGDECECPACEGEGTVQWEFTAPDGKTYYMDEDCPVCDGTGKAVEHHKVPTGRMLPPRDAMFVIDGVRFPAYYMMKAVNGLRLLGCKELRHIATSKDVANLFAVQDGIRLLVMPCIGDGTMKDVKTTKED
jgi:hypothetical protein